MVDLKDKPSARILDFASGFGYVCRHFKNIMPDVSLTASISMRNRMHFGIESIFPVRIQRAPRLHTHLYSPFHSFPYAGSNFWRMAKEAGHFCALSGVRKSLHLNLSVRWYKRPNRGGSLCRFTGLGNNDKGPLPLYAHSKAHRRANSVH